MDGEFNKIALSSILFKGRSDMYFCYLKAERIAHVLAAITLNSALKDKTALEELVALAGRLPHSILHFVAGEFDASAVLADLLSILSSVRLASTQSLIRTENAKVIADEYEGIVRRIAAENHPSPFVATKDFAVEELPSPVPAKELLSDPFMGLGDKGHLREDIKDNQQSYKGHIGEIAQRTALILDFVRKNKGVSIKQIAEVVRGCSEKTIQRELGILIEKGLVERKGERRWSVYIARPTTS